jgi:hypothetical protein
MVAIDDVEGDGNGQRRQLSMGALGGGVVWRRWGSVVEMDDNKVVARWQGKETRTQTQQSN